MNIRSEAKGELHVCKNYAIFNRLWDERRGGPNQKWHMSDQHTDAFAESSDNAERTCACKQYASIQMLKMSYDQILPHVAHKKTHLASQLSIVVICELNFRTVQEG